MFLQDYEKIRVLGKGGFGSVYKVRHAELGYIRALKVCNAFIEDKNDKAWKTFLQECKVLLNIGNGSHPNIVRIYQPRLLDNRAVVEMDCVEGESLHEYVARRKFIPMEEFYSFADQIVGAVAYCHVDIYRFLMDPNEDNLDFDPSDGRRFLVSKEKEEELIRKYGVVHNDLHSGNIIRRDYDGQYILLDFGLAIQDSHCVKSSSRFDGAIEYCSPEKLEEGDVSTRSDIYALGILLYEVLAGRVPFPYNPNDGNSPESARYKVFMQHLNDMAPSALEMRERAFEATHPGEKYERDFPPELEHIIRKCLNKNPMERYSNAKELLEAIQEVQDKDRERKLREKYIPKSELQQHLATQQTVEEPEPAPAPPPTPLAMEPQTPPPVWAEREPEPTPLYSDPGNTEPEISSESFVESNEPDEDPRIQEILSESAKPKKKRWKLVLIIVGAFFLALLAYDIIDHYANMEDPYFSGSYYNLGNMVVHYPSSYPLSEMADTKEGTTVVSHDINANYFSIAFSFLNANWVDNNYGTVLELNPTIPIKKAKKKFSVFLTETGELQFCISDGWQTLSIPTGIYCEKGDWTRVALCYNANANELYANGTLIANIDPDGIIPLAPSKALTYSIVLPGQDYAEGTVGDFILTIPEINGGYGWDDNVQPAYIQCYFDSFWNPDSTEASADAVPAEEAAAEQGYTDQAAAEEVAAEPAVAD